MAHDKLVWVADFSVNGKPSAEDWSWELGDHGWGNNEKQNYTDRIENAYIRDGILHICARKELDGSYTSARMITYGHHSWQYGTIEVEAKLPCGKGTWPAIWMLSDACREGKDWPLCGEIDIMEHVGWDEDVIHHSLHSELYNHMRNTQPTAWQTVEGSTKDFHTYRMEWDEKGITFLVDGEVKAAFLKGEKGMHTSEEGWPFDQKFYLILNVALEGWGGPIDDGALPCEMQVRAIRVYQ